jgi:hypothetical protein
MCLRQRRLFSLESTEFSRVFFFLPRGTVRVASPPSARVCTNPQCSVLEIGTHSPWISRLLSELGHEVIERRRPVSTDVVGAGKGVLFGAPMDARANSHS